MQLSAAAAGCMQQECGLAIAGSNVRLKKLSNASNRFNRLYLGFLANFMNPAGLTDRDPSLEIPLITLQGLRASIIPAHRCNFLPFGGRLSWHFGALLATVSISSYL